MPPLVRYKIPIIGHTFDYMFNSEEFLKKCRKEVGKNSTIFGFFWKSLRHVR